MLKSFIWWIVEMVIWYLFFYTILFSIKSEVNLGGMSLLIVLLGSFGIFASPFARHLGFWNKVIDKIMEKEEEKTRI